MVVRPLFVKGTRKNDLKLDFIDIALGAHIK